MTTKKHHDKADAEPAAKHEPAAKAEPAAKYTWEQIHQRLGDATAEDLADYSTSTPLSALVEMGNKIRSERILTDLLRWSGQLTDWFAHASPDEERALGLDRGLVRVAVREALDLRRMVDSSSGDSASAQATLAAATAQLEHLQDEGRKRREQLRSRLASALHDVPGGKERVDAAYGTAPDTKALAKSLTRLASLARSVLDEKGSPARRLTRSHTDAALLDAVEEEASQLSSLHDRTHGATAAPAVPAATINAQDGRCLLHMEAIKDIVDSGRASVPSAPVLVYLATAHYFHSRRRHTEEPSQPATPGQPATPPPT